MALTEKKVKEIWKTLDLAIPLLLKIEPDDLLEAIRMGEKTLKAYNDGGPQQEEAPILYIRKVADMESRLERLRALHNFLKVSRETDLLVQRGGSRSS